MQEEMIDFSEVSCKVFWKDIYQVAVVINGLRIIQQVIRIDHPFR